MTYRKKDTNFVGFASNFSNKRIYDAELIRQDLLNHINTRKGERPMDPTYGCIVWDLLFELKNPSLQSDIQNDLIRIINSDERVNLINIIVKEEEYGYSGEIIINIKSLNIVDRFMVEFNKRISEVR